MDTCELFVAPLRIPEHEQPANYDQMLNIIKLYAPGHKRRLGQSSQNFTRFCFVTMSIAMVFMYLAFLISNDLTRYVSKLIRFTKWVTSYTIVPIYCCLMILSMSLNFGYETIGAVDAIENAEKWRNTALSRNIYMRKTALSELQCLTSIVAIKNVDDIVAKEEEIFGITYEKIEKILRELGLPAEYHKYSDMKVFMFNVASNYADINRRFGLEKISHEMFVPFAKEINRTYSDLDLPSTETLNWTRGTIMVINVITVLYTLLIGMMIFLEIKNSYPIIIQIIQWFQPVLIIFILLEYYLIWNISNSIFSSYSRYSMLIDSSLEMDRKSVKFAKFLNSDVNIAEITGRKASNRLTVEHFDWIIKEQFDPFQSSITSALNQLNVREVLSQEQQDFKTLFDRCGKMSKCMNIDVFLNITEVRFAVDDPELEWGFANQAISYFRYLSFFSKYTFVPIVSPFWKIMPMPSLMFFNLMFVLLAIQLIKKNNEETSSETFI